MFRSYEKIHRLGKEEVEGILEGEVLVQEKIDGANTSIWLENSYPILASRNRIIDGGFNGFVDYIIDSPQGANILRLLQDHPEYRLYGEWLVPHTVHYYPNSYKNWYLFDIFNMEMGEYIHPNLNDFNLYNILRPAYFGTFENPTLEQLKEIVGKSCLGDRGEGIVLKNHNFVNKWGNRCYAKLVRQEFLEDNALVFNGNNKHSEFYVETYIINKWMQKPRIDKILNKLQPEIDEKLDLKHIPRITNTAYYDMISEEAWEIAKLNKEVNFKKLKELAMKKAKLLFIGILDEG